MGADEDESDAEKYDVGCVLRCEDHEDLDEKDWHGKGENLDEDHYPAVFHHRTADELLIEWGCLLVIYCELHEQEIAYSCRECHV